MSGSNARIHPITDGDADHSLHRYAPISVDPRDPEVLEEAGGIFLDYLPMAALFFDAKSGAVLDGNEEARRILGYSLEELRTLRTEDLGVEEDAERTFSPALLDEFSFDHGPFECRARDKNGCLLWVEAAGKKICRHRHWCVLVVFRDITSRKETEEQLPVIREALDDCGSSVLITRPDGAATYLNAAFGLLFGYTGDRLQEVRFETAFVDSLQGAEIFRSVALGGQWQGEVRMLSKAKREFTAFLRATPVLGEDYDVHYILFILNDITERKQLEAQVFQSENMKAIGQLAAGIAHEINTPTQYIGDNVRFLQDSFAAYSAVAEAGAELLEKARQDALVPALWEELERRIALADLPYLRDEVPLAFKQSMDGIHRVTEIIRAMRQFTHGAITERKMIDLNQAILGTITVARNEWKYVAEMETRLDPELPLVPCFPGEINQVLLNLIVNAAHAVADVVHPFGKQGEAVESKGRITVSTQQEQDWVEIRVEDTGTGIPEDIRGRVFDLFFSTKAVGKGTGQGLSICHAVVVDKHGGTLAFETETGRGTTFIMRLPLRLEDLDSQGMHTGGDSS